MLSQIRLSNFFSLRDEAILDLTPIKSRLVKNLPGIGNIFMEDNAPLLKSLAVFGANASGKSNLLKAIESSIGHIRDSHGFNHSTPACFKPFKFVDKPSPSEFEIVFNTDGCKYEYGFSLLGNKVLEEHLFYYPHKYRTMVFQRRLAQGEDYVYSFSKKFTRPKEVVTNTSPYTLFLTRAALMNRPEPVKVMKFVSEKFVVGMPSFDDEKFEQILLAHKEQLLEALRYADSDIENYEFKAPAEVGGTRRLVSYHKGSPSKPFDFEAEESSGTQRLLRLLAAFIDAANTGKVLLLDELETSLHPQLVEYAVKRFNQSEKAQLIFSTHELGLMDVEILRPDQIYFASKNFESGASEIYSLADFKDYKNYSHLRRDYLQGRFDAVPILPSI